MWLGRKKTLRSLQLLHIGIYGNTRAGKTRFLYKLFKYWEGLQRILPKTDAYQRFMKTVTDEIDKHGGSLPTTATSEELRVKIIAISQEAKELELIFTDLRGEDLAKELENLDKIYDSRSATNKTNHKEYIPEQVEQCDAFLFFFDPTSSEKPSDIDKHHQCEMERANRLIEYILKTRENHYLPVVFILTHLDKWESDDAIRQKVERWTDQVYNALVKQYKSHLRDLHPETILGREYIFYYISSVCPKDEDIFSKIIENIITLVVDSKTQEEHLSKPARRAFLATLAVLPLLVIIVWYFASRRKPEHRAPSSNDPVRIAEMKESDISDRLDELDRLLKVHPRGPQLPTVEDAEKINKHLMWMSQLLNLDRNVKEISDETRQRINSSYDSVARLVYEKAENKAALPSQLVAVLEAYLKGLPDLAKTSSLLAKSQDLFWKHIRSYAVQEIAAIIKRRHNVGSQAIDTLSEVLRELRNLEQHVRQSKVFGPRNLKKLIDEILESATFCEDRKKTKRYSVTFRVVEAFYAPGKAVEEVYNDYWEFFIIHPNKEPDEEGYALKPSKESDERVSFSTKKNSYVITLIVGLPVECRVYYYNRSEKKWHKYGQFDLTADSGPLTPLGLPLIELRQSKITKTIIKNGFEMKLEFSDFPRIPAMIRDAAMFANAKDN